MENQAIKTVEGQMRIRKPVTEVFEAFLDLSIKPNFSAQKQFDKPVLFDYEFKV